MLEKITKNGPRSLRIIGNKNFHRLVCIMYPKSNKDLNKETDSAVYFFTPAFHPLDNFSAHVINIWGKEFPTAEHAFQWKKFS